MAHSRTAGRRRAASNLAPVLRHPSERSVNSSSRLVETIGPNSDEKCPIKLTFSASDRSNGNA